MPISKSKKSKTKKSKKKSVSKKQYISIGEDKKKPVSKKQYIYVKNIASFDVERVGKTFKTGKKTRIPKELEKQIKSCSHLVIIKKQVRE